MNSITVSSELNRIKAMRARIAYLQGQLAAGDVGRRLGNASTDLDGAERALTRTPPEIGFAGAQIQHADDTVRQIENEVATYGPDVMRLKRHHSN